MVTYALKEQGIKKMVCWYVFWFCLKSRGFFLFFSFFWLGLSFLLWFKDEHVFCKIVQFCLLICLLKNNLFLFCLFLTQRNKSAIFLFSSFFLFFFFVFYSNICVNFVLMQREREIQNDSKKEKSLNPYFFFFLFLIWRSNIHLHV